MTTQVMTFEVAAPIGVAWAVVADFTRMPEWDPPIQAVERLSGTGELGTRYEVRAGFARAHVVLVAEVVDCAPPHILASAVHHHLLDQQTTWRLEPTTTGSRLTLTTEHTFKKWLRPLGWPPAFLTDRTEQWALKALIRLIEHEAKI